MTFTSHGHQIIGTIAEPRPIGMSVARCGGPNLCEVCKTESAQALSALVAVLPTGVSEWARAGDNDQIDYDEHDAQRFDANAERRAEYGMRVTVVVEWERDTAFSDNMAFDQAEQVKDVLYRVAEMGVQYQSNGIVRVAIEKLGD